MQFKVPQNVQREDKIVGPLTLKQMIICAIGGSIAYAIFVSLARTYIWITWLPPVAIVGLITFAFAFLKPLGLSFTKWILRWIEYSLLPRERKWMKSTGEVIIPPQSKAEKESAAKAKAEEKVDESEKKQEKIENLRKFLQKQKNKK